MRIFRFIENFSKAWDSLCNENGMGMLINVGKFGFMGAYLGRESFFLSFVADIFFNVIRESLAG